MDTELEPIAVIGLAGRFPGACNADQFWLNVSDGGEAIRFLSDEELLAAGVPRAALTDERYVRAVAQAPDLDMFDAGLFGMTPREARTSDPQLRLFLETAHAAMVDAGYDPAEVTDVGVFGAAGANRYADLSLRVPPDTARSIAAMSVGAWNNLGSLATMVAYKLDFTGPAMSVQTACSSSLVAIHQAVNAIRNGECDMALAGGVEVELPLDHGYWWAADGPFSRDGHCRPFDSSASGTIFGSGAGIVVLKRLAQAIADGDAVRAVLRATAVNNDGARKVGFTAPGVTGQTNVVLEATSLAGIPVTQVGLLEAHATGTVLGDPIEVAALRAAYRRLGHPGGEQRIAIASAKANVGHLGHAAGVTSFILAVFSLENERIPPTVNVTTPNPKLELDDSPFYLPERLTPWPHHPGRTRYAAVSSLGIGGTNAHAVLEEAPRRSVRKEAPRRSVERASSERPRVVLWSGATRAARDAYPEKLAAYLTWRGEPVFADATRTLQQGRRAYPARAGLVAPSAAEAITAIKAPTPGVSLTGDGDRRHDVAFLYPGQGAQHAGMALDLHRHEPRFADALDETLHLLSAAGAPVADVWGAAKRDEELSETAVAQPLLFAVEHALTQLWRSWGVTPSCLLGHSIGEITAGAVAGVFTLSEAVEIVAARARAMSRMPAGGMLAVAASVRELSELPPGVAVAAVNGPRQTVVAGPHDRLDAFATTLDERGLRSRAVRTAHAFHTEAMRAAADEFIGALRKVELRAPQIPIFSVATGRLMTDDEARDPSFWANQLVEPVLFGPALAELLAVAPRLLVEVGPGQTLTSLARLNPLVKSGDHTAVASLPARRAAAPGDQVAMLRALVAVWVDGHDVDWRAVARDEPFTRVPLPGYPYQRARHWADASAPAAPEVQVRATEEESPFSVPCWIESPRPAGLERAAGRAATALLLAEDDQAPDLIVAAHRVGLALALVSAEPGTSGERAYHLPRRRRNALEEIVRGLPSDGRPALLIHAWTLAPADERDAAALTEPFQQLCEVGRVASRRAGTAGAAAILVLSARMVDVSGDDALHPGNALLPALARTIAEEDARLIVKTVDVGSRPDPDALADELARWDRSEAVALRGDRRWAPAERPLALVAGPQVLRRQGVYLITGGCGGLGLEVARGLAQTGEQPVLVLVSRTATMPPGRRDELVVLGATVETRACDVSDVDSLARLVDDVTDRWGPVNGVLHLAGRPGSGMVQFGASRGVEETFLPKVVGALAIERVFARRPRLDFLVCFSSRAALEGQAGGGDYAAANAFLNAFVRTTSLPARRLLSIDWPAWSGTGMAADAMFRVGGRTPARRWQTIMTAAGDPVSDEHRLGSLPVVPGTRHLDLVVTAFRAEVLADPDASVQLDDVVFQRMLELSTPRRLGIGFSPEADGWSFSISSAPVTSSSPTDVQNHARGRIAQWRPAADAPDGGRRRVDLPALRAKLPEQRALPPYGSDRQAFTLGPRWRTYLKVDVDQTGGEQLLDLALPAPFEAEAAEHSVHPTLMDAATTSVRDLDKDDIHVPFMYRTVVVHGRLPAQVLSHTRRRPDAPANSIVADLDVVDNDGRVLVEVQGFTMRKAGDLTTLVATGPVRTAAADDVVGIPPELGVELLKNLLAARTPREVAVRRFRNGRWEPLAVAAPAAGPSVVPAPRLEPSGASAQESPAVPAQESPEPHAAAQPPAAGPERRGSEAGVDLADQVRGLWIEAIGVADIGGDQNFFDLGGNSLTAVELMSQVRDRFGVDLSIGAIFDYPTLGRFTEELRRLGAGR